MNKLVWIYLLLYHFLFIKVAVGQGIGYVDSVPNFSRGLYIENSQVIIPWEFNSTDLPNYGHPKVIDKTNKIIEAKWDSVTLFGGIRCKIISTFRKNKSRMKNWSFFTILVDEKDIKEIRDYLKTYSKELITNSKQGKFYFYYIDSCSIKLVCSKSALYHRYVVIQHPTKKPPAAFR